MSNLYLLGDAFVLACHWAMVAFLHYHSRRLEKKKEKEGGRGSEREREKRNISQDTKA